MYVYINRPLDLEGRVDSNANFRYDQKSRMIKVFRQSLALCHIDLAYNVRSLYFLTDLYDSVVDEVGKLMVSSTNGVYDNRDPNGKITALKARLIPVCRMLLGNASHTSVPGDALETAMELIDELLHVSNTVRNTLEAMVRYRIFKNFGGTMNTPEDFDLAENVELPLVASSGVGIKVSFSTGILGRFKPQFSFHQDRNPSPLGYLSCFGIYGTKRIDSLQMALTSINLTADIAQVTSKVSIHTSPARMIITLVNIARKRPVNHNIWWVELSGRDVIPIIQMIDGSCPRNLKRLFSIADVYGKNAIGRSWMYLNAMFSGRKNRDDVMKRFYAHWKESELYNPSFDVKDYQNTKSFSIESWDEMSEVAKQDVYWSLEATDDLYDLGEDLDLDTDPEEKPADDESKEDGKDEDKKTEEDENPENQDGEGNTDETNPEEGVEPEAEPIEEKPKEVVKTKRFVIKLSDEETIITHNFRKEVSTFIKGYLSSPPEDHSPEDIHLLKLLRSQYLNQYHVETIQDILRTINGVPTSLLEKLPEE